MKKRKRSLVIIPTYQERENLAPLVEQVLTTSGLDILIIDDNSPDGTGDIADRLAKRQRRVKVVHRPCKQGLGTAYRDGFRYALEKGYDYIFEMDADFSHHPKYLADFMVAIEKHDLVIGSRYLEGVNVVNWPLRRLILSYSANLYARLVTGLRVRDCTSGFKCFRRQVLQKLDLDKVASDGYSFQIEMNYLAQRAGFRLAEIPIVFEDRSAGSSKLSGGIIWEAVFIVWKLRLTK
jgi:dolichol-phosphate mannosyltransferase